MTGSIETQVDKSIESLKAFLDLIDHLPESPERFEEARQSLLNLYRTGKIGFRGLIPVVRSWERMGIPVADPRREQFPKIQAADMSIIEDFHKKEITGRPKLISILGDKSKIDLDQLRTEGEVREIKLDEIFVK